MKKLLAIAVIFALVTGAAFAQFSATLDTRLSIEGNTADNSITTIGGGIADAYFQGSATNDEGTLGGTVRVKANPAINPTKGPDNSAEGEFHRAFIWWKPIDQLKIFLGKEKDGLFSTGGTLTDWAFHRGAEGFTNYHDWDYWRAVFPGNWDTFGLAISIYPMDGAELNIVVPTGAGAWPLDNDGRRLNIEHLIGYLRVMGSFAIPDIGTIYLSWIGPQMDFDAVHATNGHSGNLGVSFLLTAIEGITVQAGVSAYLAKDSASNKPLLIGLAAHYNGDGFGVKFRSAFQLGGIQGATWWFGDNSRVFTKGNAFQFNVMPWFSLDMMDIFCDIGFRMNMPEVGDSTNSWHFNPYVRVPIAGGRFQAGIKVDGRSGTDTINFAIPMGLVFGF